MSDVDEGSSGEDWRNRDDDIEGGPEEIAGNTRKNARYKNSDQVPRSSFLEDSDFEQPKELERVAFLKEYAKDVTRSPEQVASSLHIAQANAAAYLKYYIYLMINSANDPDPRNVRISFNRPLARFGVSKKQYITDQELVALQPLIDRYSDVDVLDSSRKIKESQSQRLMKQKVSNAFGFGLNNNDPSGFSTVDSTNPNGFPGDPNNASPHPGYGPSERSAASRLSNSGRVNLLRWVLEKMPHIHYSRIDPFLDLFEAGEMKYMSSPDQLHEIMVKYFGPHAGGLAFNQFKDLITSYLKPSEQFGQNPYYGGGTAGMGTGYAPWAGGGTGGYGTPQPVNMYVAMGVIPAGVDPRSPEAQRLIWEWNQDQRKKKAAEEMQENIKNYVNLKMMDIVDPRKGGAAGGMGMGGDGMLAPLLMSGALRAVPSVDEQGRPVVKYEHTGMQSQNGSGENTMLGLMRIMMEMYQGIMVQQNQAPRFLESILNTMLGKFSTQSDPFELAVNAKKLADTFNPPGAGGIQQSLEAAKILLARDKMSTDRDLTLQKMNFEHENEMYDRKKQDEQELQSKEQTNEIVKNIFQIGGQTLVPLLSMFLGRAGGGAGGLAGMMQQMQNGGMAAGMPPGAAAPEMSGMGIPTGGDLSGMMGGGIPGGGPGMGMPPGAGMPVDVNQIIGMQQQSQQGNPQWYAEPTDLFGYQPPPQPVIQAPPTPAQQWMQYQQPNQQANFSSEPQPMTEPAAAPIETKKIYTPTDFEHLSLEELERYRIEGENNRDSIDSFNNALRAAIQNRMYANPQEIMTDGSVAEEIPTQTTGFSEMPSNVPLAEEHDEIKSAVPTRSALDDMAEQEPVVSNKDLRILPDTEMSEKQTQTKENDDIG